MSSLIYFSSFFKIFFDLHRWISIGSDLKYDARRDLDDVGASCVGGIIMILFLAATELVT